ncbi:EcoRI family type II restriction endonuclease [Photobacterium leiognathi]|uniref:EcoRI family type II restriction endonuclease n=1 Tax=Photobacterium leiognathi TaxID=553611 RepID=UPI000769B3E5|nr:EcoRI family type II restriction endonuclease [Photobacterium leiognathi]ELI6450301.1 hypothetical protein [Photobacterium damselae]
MNNQVVKGKGQAERLIKQHELSGGVEGIFGQDAKLHDKGILDASNHVFNVLRDMYPSLSFRLRTTISKAEINQKLSNLDSRLGQTLFVDKSNIKPDGGVIEVKDRHGQWRIVLVSESKHQGNDIPKIKAGIKQGVKKDQDLMVAGNAIERVHKNILEFRNLMLDEKHFPYVVFLQGSNFATETIYIDTPDGRKVEISHNKGNLNRIDRVTASNYGMAINQNYCENIYLNDIKLQVASLYFQCSVWNIESMVDVLLDIAKTSMDVLAVDL